VEQNACEVMTARFETEDLTIDHVRNEGQRVPVFGVGIDECLLQAMKAQP